MNFVPNNSVKQNNYFQNTLINSWNFKGLDPKTIWHGNEHAQNITAEIAESDPEDDKVYGDVHK